MSSPPRVSLYVAEPPRSLWGQPPLVTDCSVLAAFLFEEELRDEARMQLKGRALHAPYLLDSEIASVALKKASQGWPADVIHTALADFARQRIEMHRPPAEGVFALATRYKLSAYDAAYLWLSAELRAPLATFDRKLGQAAQALWAEGQ
jgi:predicted nucleic acid-binding protein